MYHLYTYLLGIHKCLWAEIFVVNCCRLQHLCIFCFSWSIQNKCKQIIVQCHFIKFRICMTRKDWSFFIYCRLEKNSTFFQHRKFLNTKSLVWGISPSAFCLKPSLCKNHEHDLVFTALNAIPIYTIAIKYVAWIYVVPSVEMGQFFFALRFFVKGKKFLDHTG